MKFMGADARLSFYMVGLLGALAGNHGLFGGLLSYLRTGFLGLW